MAGKHIARSMVIHGGEMSCGSLASAVIKPVRLKNGDHEKIDKAYKKWGSLTALPSQFQRGRLNKSLRGKKQPIQIT